MKMFKIPINDERIQSLTKEQIDLMLYSNIIDDPEKLSKLENYFYDPDFDEEFENLNGGKPKSSEALEILDFNFKISKSIKKKKEVKKPVVTDNDEDYEGFLEV